MERQVRLGELRRGGSTIRLAEGADAKIASVLLAGTLLTVASWRRG